MHPPKVHIPAGKAEAVALNSGTGVPSTGLPGMGHSLELVGEAKPTGYGSVHLRSTKHKLI